MSEENYLSALQTKLLEESQGPPQAEGNDIVKELADVYQVLEALVAAYGVDPATVAQTKTHRQTTRSGFLRHLKLIWADAQ